ncbi:unnamed protein product [Prunus armeniaca]
MAWEIDEELAMSVFSPQKDFQQLEESFIKLLGGLPEEKKWEEMEDFRGERRKSLELCLVKFYREDDGFQEEDVMAGVLATARKEV